MERFYDNIKNSQILVFLMAENSYNENVYSLVKMLTEISERICYVTLNRPFITLEKEMKRRNITTNNMFFIDAITNTVSKPKETENCSFVSHPGALTELSLEVSKALKANEPDCVLIDSLSTLLLYEKPITIARFAENMSTKIRTYEYCKGVMTSIKSEVDNFVLHQLNIISDGVYHVD